MDRAVLAVSEREIEEILEKSGDLGPSKKPKRRRKKESLFKLMGLYVKNALSGKLWSLSPGRISSSPPPPPPPPVDTSERPQKTLRAEIVLMCLKNVSLEKWCW